jgi:hypothetical protein
MLIFVSGFCLAISLGVIGVTFLAYLSGTDNIWRPTMNNWSPKDLYEANVSFFTSILTVFGFFIAVIGARITIQSYRESNAERILKQLNSEYELLLEITKWLRSEDFRLLGLSAERYYEETNEDNLMELLDWSEYHKRTGLSTEKDLLRLRDALSTSILDDVRDQLDELKHYFDTLRSAADHIHNHVDYDEFQHRKPDFESWGSLDIMSEKPSMTP